MAKIIAQAATLAFHRERICLVTSSSGKRWVLPKGCCERGKTIQEIAHQEAWEEAGIRGNLEDEPLGSYRYRKTGNLYEVSVFLMQVTHVATEWLERYKRQRRWLKPDTALGYLDDEGLCEVLRNVFEEQRAAVLG